MVNFQFTRYLYEKDEVKITLLMSLLNKSDEALFWAYELFYSGFKDELINWIWSIYYDFYYSKNASFEKYLSNKLTKPTDETKATDEFKDKLIALIINNLLIRPFSIDVFILKKITSTEAKEIILFPIFKKKLEKSLSDENYLEIASLILNKLDENLCVKTLVVVISFFIECGLKIDEKKIIKEYQKMIKINDKKTLLLSRIIQYFTLLKNIKLGKNLYAHVDDEDIVIYETINYIPENNKFLPYKILPVACMFNIDSNNYLSLFHLKRDKYNIDLAYRYNWLFYASYSPLWKKRILKYNGIIDDKEKKIIFSDENDEELFYNEFGYEPDEQKIKVQQKSIQIIKKERSWLSFYNDYKNNSIIKINAEKMEDKYLIF
jgi:hypothetical protein